MSFIDDSFMESERPFSPSFKHQYDGKWYWIMISALYITESGRYKTRVGVATCDWSYLTQYSVIGMLPPTVENKNEICAHLERCIETGEFNV